MGQLAKLLRLAVSRTIGFITPGTLEERDEVVRREVRRTLEGFLLKYSEAMGKKTWCDKTPFNIADLKDIEWAFPNARYICLYRNGWDVVHSCLGLPEKDYMWWSLPYVARHPQNYPAALLESWVEKTQALLDFEKRNPRTCRILYEALVMDPVGALDPVFKSLGLDWDPSLLDKVFMVPHDPGGGDYKIQSTARIEKDRVGQGASLDPALLARIPGDLLKRQKALHLELGYP
jgi:protein-tyrosine sulfotransferase